MQQTINAQTMRLLEAIYNRDIEEVNAAITSGAQVNAHLDQHKLTPLHYAVIQNFYDGVNVLLRAGANKNVETDVLTKSQTPRQIAHLFDYQNIAELLENNPTEKQKKSLTNFKQTTPIRLLNKNMRLITINAMLERKERRKWQEN